MHVRPVCVSDVKVVKEMAVASRDVSADESLYETVKELKDGPAEAGLPNGTIQPSPDEPPPHPPALLNGHISPSTPERGPIFAGAEYASVNLNKKSRHSADMEAKRRSGNATVPQQKPQEEPEEDLPPPVPEKVLDENDNQPALMMNGLAEAGLHNGEVSLFECVSLGLIGRFFLSDYRVLCVCVCVYLFKHLCEDQKLAFLRLEKALCQFDDFTKACSRFHDAIKHLFQCKNERKPSLQSHWRKHWLETTAPPTLL